MKEQIKREELNNLINIMQEKGIMQDWILGLCNVKSLIDISMVQYNYLIAIIKRTEIIKGGSSRCY